MHLLILIVAALLVASVLLQKLFVRIGMPVLLGFILLGLAVGQGTQFGNRTADYELVGNISTLALIFIMFYGGFGTNAKRCRPILAQAVLLASAGVILTAVFLAALCYYLFHWHFMQAALMGAVIASTDAASVFSILRSRRLNLRYNTASLLEVESGSNDPTAYMLTLIILLLDKDGFSPLGLIKIIVLQLFVAAAVAFVCSRLSTFLLRKMAPDSDAGRLILTVGVALLSYALPTTFGGNGFLCTYLCGLALGNNPLIVKKDLVTFWNGFTGLAQVTLFFLLGFLASFPKLVDVAVDALAIMLLLTFLVRPAALSLLLLPFRPNLGQIILLSCAGLRGATSVVFAIMVMTAGAMGQEIFHLTFFIVLLSLTLQGAFLPKVAKYCRMLDEKADVMKTFTDYSEELPVEFIKFRIPPQHIWAGKKVAALVLPPQTLLVYLERDGDISVPNGQTMLHSGDKLILAALEATPIKGISLSEITVGKGHEYVGKSLREINVAASDTALIMLVKRGRKVLIPRGDTVIHEDDILIKNIAQ